MVEVVLAASSLSLILDPVSDFSRNNDRMELGLLLL